MRINPVAMSIFLTAHCLFTTSPTFAANQCGSVFEAMTSRPFPASPNWRKTPGDLFSAVRANAPHNWAYFKKIKPQLQYLKDAFEVTGVGIGDFHILNIGDIALANGTRKIGLIDLDDGGRTSLFADFTRAVIGNQVSPYKIPARDLWEAYLMGLSGNKVEKPSLVEDVLKYDEKDYLKLQEKYLNEMIDHKKFSSAAELQPLSEADPVTMDIYQNSAAAFEKTLGDAKILDTGFKVKATGGSQGVPRIWYLIEKNGEKSIIEFKTLAEPAMELYQHQDSQKIRIEQLIEAYRPQKQTYGMYQFVDGGKYQFIARQRLKSFLNLDPTKIKNSKDVKNGQEMYRYLANKAGLWQAELGAGTKIAEALTKDEANAFNEFTKIIQDYIEIMKQENK